MSDQEYTAEQALDLLLAKLREKSPDLADDVQEAIDAGKDASETEPAPDRRKKDRVYRKTVAYSHAEALQVALKALHAYFVEQPLFVDSALQQFAKAAVGVPPPRRILRGGQEKEAEPVFLEHAGEEKNVEIEIQTETQISKTGEPTQSIEKIPLELVAEQERNFKKLGELTNTFIQ